MTPILVRPARTVDADDLRRLAALDSARPLTGDVLLAVSGGDVAAAISLDTGAVIADPFRAPPTWSTSSAPPPARRRSPAGARPRLALRAVRAA